MTRDDYAREVLRAGRDLGISPRGIVIGFATVSVESSWLMWANRADPASLSFPHDRVGSDANSVGLFQQRAPWWGTVAQRMDPYHSARMFFEELKKLPYNDNSRSPGWYAQQVQKSAYPDRYDQRMSEAQALYDRIAADTSQMPDQQKPAENIEAPSNPTNSGGTSTLTVEARPDVVMYTSADSGPRDPAQCQAIVYHANQGPERGSLEGLLAFCQNKANGASYNRIVDARGRIGLSNDDNYIPWAAGTTGNRIGLHVCALGYAEQSRAEWLDPEALLDGLALQTAAWSQQYGIPLVKISGADLRARKRGVCGHADISDAWHEVDHTDPGPNFPYDVVLAKARALLNPTTEEDDMAFTDEDRRKLNEVHEQVRKGWPQLGSNEKGEPLTLVDGVAKAIGLLGKIASKLGA